jgi:hypothetical protein
MSSSPSSPSNGCFSFFVSSQTTDDSLLTKIDANGEPARLRKQHKKSRAGCHNCKLKRKKARTPAYFLCPNAKTNSLEQCDEARPSCTNCVRRSEDCRFPEVSSTKDRASLVSRRSEQLNAEPMRLERTLGLNDNLSMEQIRLFHHFANHTVPTLVYPAGFWTNVMMPIALTASLPYFSP